MEIKSTDAHHSVLQTGWLIPPTLVIVSTWESICLKRVLGKGEFEPEASFCSEQWDISIKVYIKWYFKSKLCFVYIK